MSTDSRFAIKERDDLRHKVRRLEQELAEFQKLAEETVDYWRKRALEAEKAKS